MNAQEAIQKQKQVLAAKVVQHSTAAAGKPTAYVDANAGLMRPDKSTARAEATVAPPIPSHPMVLMTHPAPPNMIPPSSTNASITDAVDVVFVKDTRIQWESPEGLLARIQGTRFMDVSGKQVAFRGAMRSLHIILYVTAAFTQAYPKHVAVLDACSRRCPMMKKTSGGGGALMKRFDVRHTDLPAKVEYPKVSYVLQTDKGPPIKRMDSKGAEVDVKALSLSELCAMCSLCYDRCS